MSQGESSALLTALGSSDPETRRLAVQRIADEDTERVGELLVRALGDDDWRVRKEAAQAARSAPRRAEVIKAVVSALDDHTNIGLRNAAVEALVSIGRDAVPAAVHALATLDADGRKLAIEVLGGVPDVDGTRALVRALGDDDPNVRATAAEALAGARVAGEEARSLAVAGLKRTLAASEAASAALRLSALEALIGLEADLRWADISPLLTDPLLRRTAVATAAGCHDPEAIAALVEIMAESRDGLARDAAIGLVESTLAEGAEPSLRNILRTELERAQAQRHLSHWLLEDDERIRGAALVLLGLCARPTDAGLLARALGDDALEGRAVSALELMGHEAALPLLIEARSLGHGAATAVALASSLVTAATDEHREAFRAALSHSSPDVVAAAVHALGSHGDETDLARAEALAVHADARVGSAARSALVALASRMPEAAAARAQAIAPDSIRATAACVMLQGSSRKDAPSPGAISYLKRALTSGDARARRAAVEALAATSTDEARDALALALADEEREVQIAAIRALGVLKHAGPIVTLLGSATDVEIVGAAYRALAAADPARATSEARRALSAASPMVASVAVGAVAGCVGTSRDDVMLAALDHSSEEVVRVALSCLSPPFDARTLARLGRCLDHASWDLRRATAELLGQVGAPAAALLQERYERESDPTVREAILDAVRSANRLEGT